MIIDALILEQTDLIKKSFFEWLFSHFSGSLPPHRYHGKIEVRDRLLTFEGTDNKTDDNVNLIINKEHITEVYYGYDDLYNIFQTRGFGSVWSPVRIKVSDDTDTEKIYYIVTGFDFLKTTNMEFYNFLKEWLS